MTTLTQARTNRFQSPFEIETPPGAEGWERMYPPYLLFSYENRAWIYAASAVTSHVFAVPPTVTGNASSQSAKAPSGRWTSGRHRRRSVPRRFRPTIRSCSRCTA